MKRARRAKNIVGAVLGSIAGVVAPVNATQGSVPPVATAPAAKRRRKDQREVEITDEARLAELDQAYAEAKCRLPGVAVPGRHWRKGALPAKVNAAQWRRLGQRFMIECMGVQCVDVNGNVITPPPLDPTKTSTYVEIVDGVRYVRIRENEELTKQVRDERAKQVSADDKAERATPDEATKHVGFLPKQY